MLGLPDTVRGLLFDLDGVLTQTAKVHAAAWKHMFDDYLRARSHRDHTKFVPFDAHDDYDTYVDGKPRADGTRSFLASRGIELPEGAADDGPDVESIVGLGNRKNQLVLQMIHDEGVEPYPGSVRYLQAVRAANLPHAVVSSSTNCHDVLVAAGIADYFDHEIDGHVAEQQHLHGKPAPDTYLAGAKLIGVEPSAAAVFEDALAGVASGKAGGFGTVVGVDRVGQHDALLQNGATMVVDDLGDLLA
jgi:beta-phosphoglucomutase family hydrolase